MSLTSFKAALNQGFKNLRKAGYAGRQNFTCCMSCGNAALPEGTTKYAFYHRQDAANMIDAAHRRQRLGVMLAWGGDGIVIAKAFEDAGLEVQWDGTDAKRIHVREAEVAATPTKVPADVVVAG